MNKTFLIIAREYLTRVRKKYFIILTIIGPILMAALFVVPAYLANLESGNTKKIAIVDQSDFYKGYFQNSKTIEFIYETDRVLEEKQNLHESDYYAILHIIKTDSGMPRKAFLYSNKQMTLAVKSRIQDQMSALIENQVLLDVHNIKKEDLNTIKKQSKINLNTIRINKDGSEKKSFTEVNWVIGMFLAVIIYFFVFFFGSQVMRSVIEEKVNRIVEIIVSSVKPFQLMAGKIIGVALVGLTQIVLWVVLTTVLVGIAQMLIPELANPGSNQMLDSNQLMPNTETIMQDPNMINQIGEIMQSMNFGLIIGSFIFLFLGGYLLYGALFAAIGAAVDNEADTQSFVLPVTIPLILAIVSLQYIVNNPDGPVSFWFSIIPFTSPIVMMMRITLGVPIWQVILSMGLLVLGCIFTIWVAAKIYRTGILMYGKKANYKELWKWLFYRG